MSTAIPVIVYIEQQVPQTQQTHLFDTSAEAQAWIDGLDRDVVITVRWLNVVPDNDHRALAAAVLSPDTDRDDEKPKNRRVLDTLTTAGRVPNQVRPSDVLVEGARITADVIAMVQSVERALVEAAVRAAAGSPVPDQAQHDEQCESDSNIASGYDGPCDCAYRRSAAGSRCRDCGSLNPNARHGYGENRECLWPCNHEVIAGENECGACSPPGSVVPDQAQRPEPCGHTVHKGVAEFRMGGNGDGWWHPCRPPVGAVVPQTQAQRAED